MKEAAGEANMTVITIVLIAIVLVVGTIIVNSLMSRTGNNSCCTAMGGKVVGKNCELPSGDSINMGPKFTEKYCPESNFTK